MSDATQSPFHDSPAGTTASQGVRGREPLRLAPTSGAGFNALELDLVPVACMALRDTVFAFDSSFVQPQAGTVRVATLLERLAPLRRRHADAAGALPLLALFGHADPVGDAAYNKQLSGRRAKAVYALLTHRVDLWQELHDHPLGGDDWRRNGAVDTMRATVGAGAAVPRAQVFQQYLAALMPTPLARGEFLGRGLDPLGKADFQGCGELNPVLLFSAEQDQAFRAPAAHAARNAANQPNRRVLIYLFPPAVVPDPRRWPCPRASESAAGCQARLFQDANQRLTPGPTERQFARGEPTFACRLYARIAADSPCEQGNGTRIPVRVVPSVLSRHGNVMAFVQRVDGTPLPQVQRMRLGSTTIEFVFASPDGRLFFLPPADGDASISQGLLPDGAGQLVLEDPATYTADAAAAARSLRQQMAILRDCAAQRVARGRQDGESAAELRSMHAVIIGDGHCRFADALDRVRAAGGDVRGGAAPAPARALRDQGTTAPGDAGGVDGALRGFGPEHGTALDSFTRSDLSR